MGDDAEEAFRRSCLIRSASERRAEAAFVLGECAFDVPSLAVQPGRKTRMHRLSEAAGRSCVRILGTSAVYRNDGGPDA